MAAIMSRPRCVNNMDNLDTSQLFCKQSVTPPGGSHSDAWNNDETQKMHPIKGAIY